jgi:iron complex outermembrane receptor protein
MIVINYEGGWKGTFDEGHIRTQLAAYYQTFKNYQANFARPADLGFPNIDSIGEFKGAQTTSKIWGIEASAQGRWGGLAIDASAAYSKSKLGSFGIVTNPYFPLFDNGEGVADTTSKYYGLYGTGPNVLMNGATTPFAPEFTANAGVSYDIHTGEFNGNELVITPRVDVAYKGHSYAQLFHNPSTLLPAVTLVNASLRFENGPWWASLWVTNLFDKRYPGAKQNVGVDPANGFFPAPHIVGIVYMAPPMLMGLRVGRNF